MLIFHGISLAGEIARCRVFRFVLDTKEKFMTSTRWLGAFQPASRFSVEVPCALNGTVRLKGMEDCWHLPAGTIRSSCRALAEWLGQDGRQR
jgi:hypothetical protein